MPINQSQIILNNSSDVPEIVKPKDLPSLNGLRGVSIILVVMSHLQLSTHYLYGTIFNGVLGVNIFFVISGFLITTLCLKEKNLTGTISLRNFYVRRVLRILPVAYLYVFVVFILDKLFHFGIAYYQYLAALFFLQNFSYFRKYNFADQLSHYWSLSVEEQFYVVFPFLLKKNYKFFYWSVVFIVAVLPLLCLLQEFLPLINNGATYYFTHYLIKFQSIATGCLLSLLVFQNRFNYKWLLKYKIAGNLLALGLIFYLGYDGFYTIKTVFVNLLIGALIAYVILSNLIHNTDFIFRFLNSKILELIGKLSYSIYIWQQLIVFGKFQSPVLNSAATKLSLLLVVSFISYFCYERYFLKLKTKFSKIANIA